MRKMKQKSNMSQGKKRSRPVSAPDADDWLRRCLVRQCLVGVARFPSQPDFREEAVIRKSGLTKQKSETKYDNREKRRAKDALFS